MTLRPYQQAAVDAVVDYLCDREGNPCVVIPTGGGKTHVINELIRLAVDEWGGRVLLLAHVKELIEQPLEKLGRDDVGVYHAGLGRREKSAPIVLAGIHSVYRRAAEMGAFNLILIDEAHMLPPEGEGMYREFLRDARIVNPRARLVGLTATPYRTSTGELCGPENLLNQVVYEASVADLVVQGYLCKLRSKQSRRELDTSKLRVRGGEFVASDVEDLVDSDRVVDQAVGEIIEQSANRRSVLVFAASVRHAMHVADLLPDAEVVVGDTPADRRTATLKAFREGRVKYLVNVNVLSTGFDAPNIDCIAMLRPTLSPGLYYQQVGRGLRLCEGKADCLVLDFAGNVKRHGPIDQIQPPRAKRKRDAAEEPDEVLTKVCAECLEIVPRAASVCFACGMEFTTDREPKHSGTADEAPILGALEPPRDRVVLSVAYAVHRKKDADDSAPRTMRVDYIVDVGQKVSEWVCIEHDGFAREKAVAWWEARSHDTFPVSAEHAVAIANAGGLAMPETIRTKQDGKWERVVGAGLGEKPAPTWILPFDEEEIPF